MTKIWGLDMSEIRLSKLRNEYMWTNRDFHYRRTRFIVYQATVISCVISESLGMKALIDYATIRSSIVASTQPPFEIDAARFIHAAAFNTFVGVFVATIFGAAFFFDLFWPERRESSPVKWAWNLCSVLAFIFTLSSGASMTDVVLEASVRVTDENGIEKDLNGYNGPPLLYRDNAFAVAATAFMWVGCFWSFFSMVYLIENWHHIRKHGTSRSGYGRGELAALEDEAKDEKKHKGAGPQESRMLRQPAEGVAAPINVHWRYGRPFRWPDEPWVPPGQFSSRQCARWPRYPRDIGVNVGEANMLVWRFGAHAKPPRGLQKELEYCMRFPGAQDGTSMIMISRGDLKKKLNEAFEKGFAEPRARLDGFSQAERQEIREKWNARWGERARWLDKEVITPKELESVDWYISILQFAFWIVHMMRHEQSLKTILDERKLGWHELAKVDSEKRQLLAWGKTQLDNAREDLGEARFKRAYAMAMWLFEVIADMERRREMGREEEFIPVSELHAPENGPGSPQVGQEGSVLIQELWGGPSGGGSAGMLGFSDLVDEIDRMGGDWRAERRDAGVWEVVTVSSVSEASETKEHTVAEEGQGSHRSSSAFSFEKTNQEEQNGLERRWEEEVLDPASRAEPVRASMRTGRLRSWLQGTAPTDVASTVGSLPETDERRDSITGDADVHAPAGAATNPYIPWRASRVVDLDGTAPKGPVLEELDQDDDSQGELYDAVLGMWRWV